MASSSLWLPAPSRTAPSPPGPARGGGGGGGGKRTQARNGEAPRSFASASASALPPPAAPPPQQQQQQQQLAPSYEERCRAASEFSKLRPDQRRGRKLFVPRSVRDFDDGGSFPEIHVAQYPRNMGNPHLGRRRGAGAGVGVGAGAGHDHASKDRALVPLSAAGTGTGTGTGNGTGNGTGTVAKAGRTLAIEVDASGELSYDAVVTGGTNANKTVYTRHSDLRGSDPSPDDVALPTEDEERRAAIRTAAAIGAVVSAESEHDRPSGSAVARAKAARDRDADTRFVRYESRPDAPGYNPAAAQRIIRLVPAQVDPMQPPKHMHRKAPRGPAEDPVPVLHAPPEKLTKEERDKWNVPACISNWKNSRGYTIPLDKRLAADGRGLRDETTVNPNFATLSESLYVAERQAREEVRMRAQVQRRLAESERDRREAELRELASRARRERAEQAAGGVAMGGSGGAPGANLTALAAPLGEGDGRDHVHNDSYRQNGRDDAAAIVPTDDHDDIVDNNNNSEKRTIEAPESEEAVAARQRERLRQERRREREKELRLERFKKGSGALSNGGDGNGDDDDDDDLKAKRRRLESERDVSERVALGTHIGVGTAGGDVDSRLYNQSAGMDSGFGADDEYNTYSEPMFGRQGVVGSGIYRPSRGEASMAAMDGDTQYEKLVEGAAGKFQADKGFAGAEGGRRGGPGGGGSGGQRTAPVQFERGGTK